MADATMSSGAVPDRGTATMATLIPWWLVLIQGIIALIIGVMLFVSPATTTLILVQVLGWYWLFSGIFQLGSLFIDRTKWGWRVLSGLIGIAAGAYIIGAPFIGTVIVLGTVTLLLGIGGIIIGIADIAKGFQGGGWGIGILGVLSLIIGIAIAFNVPKYLVTMPWVWSILAVVAGVSGIVGAFQLRKVQKA